MELDYMEYASDGEAQAAYVSSGSGAYTSDLCSGGTPSASSIFSASYPASQAFDNTETTMWLSGNVGFPCWLKYDFGSGNEKTITKYTYQAGQWNVNSCPKDWTFQGSNDDSIWDTLHTVTGAPSWSQYEKREYTFSNTTAYRYYRIHVTDNHGGGYEGECGEMEMMSSLPPSLLCYSENTTKTQGNYSLKAIAKETDSLNETLTKTLTGGDKINLSDIDELKIDVRASRTGTNFQIQLHDSGGTTSTKNIPISVANTWEEVLWDISGITNTDKDDIDQIIIKITNAS